MATYDYQPDYAASPGSVLEEHLAVHGLSHAEFARRCGRSAKLISEIVAGKAPVQPATALEFEKVLGMSARIWLGIEADYRLHQRRANEAADEGRKANDGVAGIGEPRNNLATRCVHERLNSRRRWVEACARGRRLRMKIPERVPSKGDTAPHPVAYRHFLTDSSTLSEGAHPSTLFAFPTSGMRTRTSSE